MSTILLAAAEAFSVAALIRLLIVLVIIGVIMYVIWWAISQIPLPPPFMVAVRVVFVLVCVLIVLAYLLPLLGVSL
jgi:hypothetical protein